MKKFYTFAASFYGCILVLLIDYVGRIPVLPADFLPALLPLLIDPAFVRQARALFWSGPVLLTGEWLLLLVFPWTGLKIPCVNAIYLCCVVMLDTGFSYARCWSDSLHCRRGKICRITAETLTRSLLLSVSVLLAVFPALIGLDRFVVGRSFQIWAAVSGLLMLGLYGWVLSSRIRKRRIMFSREKIRRELKTLQDKETDSRKVRVHSDPAQDLYSRAVDMMRSKKPFLLYEFTLQDMAQRLVTNKMYLSRTINTFSGRGFRSFVNFFRIQYSIALFRKTPTMKVHALAELCGFHSQVTYTAAFKLEMGMTPGEYFTLLVQGEEVPPCPEYPSTFPARVLPERVPFYGRGGSR